MCLCVCYLLSCNDVQAFEVAEKEFGIEPIMSGEEMASREIIDKTAMLPYLAQFYELFRKQSVERDAGMNSTCCCCQSQDPVVVQFKQLLRFLLIQSDNSSS